MSFGYRVIFLFLINMLECHSHHEADSVLVYARIVVVVKAADVFHMYEFEYVMNAE